MANRPRVLVFQPLVAAGEPFSARLLGLQFWLAERLTDIGLEGASGLFRIAGSERLMFPEPPTDAEVRRTMLENGALFGVVTSFVVLGGRPHLAVARLFRAQRGHPLRLLARWKFEGESEHLPAAAHRLLIEIAPRLGVGLQPSTWAQVFGTNDTVAADDFLAALGCYSASDQGFVIDDPEAALRAILSAISRGMKPAIEFLPHLVKSLRTSGSAPVEMLSAAVHRAIDVVGVAPASWQPVIRELAPERGLLN